MSNRNTYFRLREAARLADADNQLRTQQETFNELSGPVGTIVPISLATPPSEYNRHTVSLTKQSLALANQTNETVAQLNTVIAGQAAELAQLRQAVLVLAQSTKSVEHNTAAIVDSVEVVRKQTATKIKPFAQLDKEMRKLWREIIEDTMFANEGARLVAVSRTLTSIMSIGARAPEARATARKECYNHIKALRTKRDRLEALYEYAVLNHPNATADWAKLSHGTFKINKVSYTIMDAFTPDFLQKVQKDMLNIRGMK